MYNTITRRLPDAVPDSYGERPLPATPTDHLPGTEGKIQVMIERAQRGEALFHPQDAQLPRTKKKRVYKVHLDIDELD